jgi:predicted Mrr-cat superfamily restriction endonuclease
VTPEKALLAGLIAAPYRFDASPLGQALPHVRPVTWQTKIPLRSLSEELRYSLGSIRAVFSVEDEGDEIQKALSKPMS